MHLEIYAAFYVWDNFSILDGIIWSLFRDLIEFTLNLLFFSAWRFTFISTFFSGGNSG